MKKVNIEIEFDDALNEAGWVLTSKLQEHGNVNGRQFNNMKTYLKMAIETYLNHSDNQMNTTKALTESKEEKEALDNINQIHLRDYQKKNKTEHQEEMSEFSDKGEWSGEGLPPAGVECECFCFDQNAWLRVKVLDAATESVEVAVTTACNSNGYKEVFWGAKFRPCKSPEEELKCELSAYLWGRSIPKNTDKLADLLVKGGFGYRKDTLCE